MKPPSPHFAMSFEFFSAVDTGRARNNNEDSVAIDEASALAVLADGMGGYNAGEIASGMATTFIKSELGRWLSQAGRHANAREVRRAMEICVDNANRSIFNAANSNPQYSGMGTTLVLGVFQDDRLMLGHIGDSRCYRLRAGHLAQITKDHSLLQEQLDAGLITLQQAATSSNKNLVTRALGVEDAVLLEVNEHRVEPGDIYMMCSDGLSDMVDDEGIAKILGADMPLVQRAAQLIDAANANGGRDNISVLLAQVDANSKKRGLISRLLGK
jgi:PPM family protein phosphatase